MITFNCPNCSKSYTVADEYAGKRTTCRQCGAPLFVPGPAEGGWEPVPDDPVGEATALRGGPRPATSDPEPDAYGRADRVALGLAAFNRVLGCLGMIGCFIGGMASLSEKGRAALALACLGGFIFFGFSMLVTEVVYQTVLVVVDLARNTRVVHKQLVEAARGGS
jgi:hypothetical protein